MRIKIVNVPTIVPNSNAIEYKKISIALCVNK